MEVRPDYRNFIFDENEKVDLKIKQKIKQSKLLMDPFLKNFLAKNDEKKILNGLNTQMSNSASKSKLHAFSSKMSASNVPN